MSAFHKQASGVVAVSRNLVFGNACAWQLPRGRFAALPSCKLSINTPRYI